MHFVRSRIRVDHYSIDLLAFLQDVLAVKGGVGIATTPNLIQNLGTRAQAVTLLRGRELPSLVLGDRYV